MFVAHANMYANSGRDISELISKEPRGRALMWSAPTRRRFSMRRLGAAKVGQRQVATYQSADKSAHSKKGGWSNPVTKERPVGRSASC
jgi:hypothetical protein